MTTTDKIVTLARKYCIDNFRYWFERYQNERTCNKFPYTYTNQDYDIFPRYQTLDAILKGIETVVGKTYASKQDCLQELKQLGKAGITRIVKRR